jgi:acetyl esterase/lipase
MSATIMLVRRCLLAVWIFALSLQLASCVAPRQRMGVVYDTRTPDQTLMDVRMPPADGKLHPGLVFIHGGGWLYGNRDHHDTIARRFAEGGYVTATVEYRLAPEGRYPKAVQDVGCALSHFRAHASEYDLDPDRVAIFGYSAGGHLAALVAVAGQHPSHVPDCAAGGTHPPRAVIAGSAPLDLRGQDNVVLSTFLGGSEDEHPDRYVTGSPITHVRPGLPPFLLLHGSGDLIVDNDQSLDMQAQLRAAGNQAEVMQVAGGGHLTAAGAGLSDQQWLSAEKTPESWLAMLDFLERTVGAP